MAMTAPPNAVASPSDATILTTSAGFPGTKGVPPDEHQTVLRRMAASATPSARSDPGRAGPSGGLLSHHPAQAGGRTAPPIQANRRAPGGRASGRAGRPPRIFAL